MPTPSPAKGGKLPKAVPMHCRYVQSEFVNFTKDPSSYVGGHIFVKMQPVAILPCATKSQAARKEQGDERGR